MNDFDMKLQERGLYPLKSDKISILCVLITNRCNLRCTHCYLDSSPDKKGAMSSEDIATLMNIIEEHRQITAVELTGGEPVLHPGFRHFVRSVAEMGRKVMVASNLTVCVESSYKDIPEFLAENGVKIYSSLPSYSEEDVDRQRGKGSFRKTISVLERLNGLGYGLPGSGLEIDLEYNPLKATMAPDRELLEKIYREKLKDTFGISFNNLITLNNTPLGRLRKSMKDDEYGKYIKKLSEHFNPGTIESMMCRQMITAGYDGKLYDCGFLMKLNRTVQVRSNGISSFNYKDLSNRTIATATACLACTAGSGLNCFPEGIAN